MTQGSTRNCVSKASSQGYPGSLFCESEKNFRNAFSNFDFEKVARFGDKDIERLLSDAGIIEHRGKIEATVNNARAALATIEQHGSLANFLWSFEPAEKSDQSDN